MGLGGELYNGRGECFLVFCYYLLVVILHFCHYF
jgi:hypothetical protein